MMDSNENKDLTPKETEQKDFSKREERTASDYGMDQDFQEGREEACQEECYEQKANECEEKADEGEEEGSSSEVRSFDGDGAEDRSGEPLSAENSQASENGETVTGDERPSQYGCSYTPPYYVPDFTIVNPNPDHGEKEKEGEKRKTRLIVLGLTACFLLASCVGALAGIYFFRRHYEQPTVPSNGSVVTVVKNDGSIVVNEIVGSTGYEHLSVSEVVELVADSVVEITTSQVTTNPFWGNYVTSGAGSGVVVSADGYIITNNHVIEGATSVTVRLTSGAEYEAIVVGGDADSDIAVLKIEATELRAAVLGKSSALKVGQDVVAIGNPLGELGGTVTNGIISAMDRSVIVDGYPMTLLQTNAAINPGNSGGGLFNMAGELIGIVNAKTSEAGIEGLGFAIPIDVAWEKAEDLMQYGYVTGKILLDFSVEAQTTDFTVQDGGGFFATRYTFPAGVYVVSSQEDSLKKYDRIMSVNGITVNSISDFYQALEGLVKGDELKLVISRLDTSGRNAQFREHTVTLTVKVTEPTE